MNRNITFAPNEFYHLYNRGVEKRDIFMNSNDYDRFLTLLYICNGTKSVHLQNHKRTKHELIDFNDEDRGDRLVDIIAYCLMPNHFHVLVRAVNDTGISTFMQKLSTGYTMYFNKRNDRSGSLFQGTFKATHANEDRYLKYLISYIHLNPIKLIEPKWKEAGIVDKQKAQKYLKEFKYSSFPDYLKIDRMEQKILNTENLPEYFDTLDSFEAEVEEWLSYREYLETESQRA